jgi:O-antigen ligase
MDMLSSSPIWGVGKAQFVEHHPRTAHNSLVLCLAETGLAGTALWLGLFYFTFRDTKRAAAYQAQQALAAEPEGAKPKRAGVPCQSMVIQVSLIAFAVGGFFLSRTYTPPLYVYLGLAVAAAQGEWGPPGEEMSGATGRDWRNIGLLTLAGLLLVQFLIRLWGS